MAKYAHFTRLLIKTPALNVLSCELNRPDRLNVFDEATWSELHEFFTSVKFDAECRVIVLSGSGRAFTAGLDLASGGLDSFGPKRSEKSSAAENALRIRYMGEQWQNSLSSVAACGKCVVAAIHGPCIGAGVELISACDIRWCSKDAFFVLAEVDIGMAADVGGLQRFPKIVGNDSLVRELALSARRMHADEALRAGFVSRVCVDRAALLEEACQLAVMIASKSPLATFSIKTLLNYTRDHSVSDSLEYAITWNAAMLQTPDMSAAALAKMAKRQATFPNLPDVRAKL